MADKNSSDQGKSGQVQGSVPERLRSIIDRSKVEMIGTIGTLRALTDLLERSIGFEADIGSDKLLLFAADIQSMGTRALWSAVLTITMSERLNVCGELLKIR
jgi:hypothetical protein